MLVVRGWGMLKARALQQSTDTRETEGDQGDVALWIDGIVLRMRCS